MNHLQTYCGAYLRLDLNVREISVEDYRYCPEHSKHKILDTMMLFCPFCAKKLEIKYKRKLELPKYWQLKPKNFPSDEWEQLVTVLTKENRIILISEHDLFNKEFSDDKEICKEIDSKSIEVAKFNFRNIYMNIMEALDTCGAVETFSLRFGIIQYWN